MDISPLTSSLGEKSNRASWGASPAMITERETTVVVPTGFTAAMRADGTIEVTRDTAAQKEAAE